MAETGTSLIRAPSYASQFHSFPYCIVSNRLIVILGIHYNTSEIAVVRTHTDSVSNPPATALEPALFPFPSPEPEPKAEGRGLLDPDPDNGAAGNVGNGDAAVSKPSIPEPVGGASVAIASVVSVLWL
jgi:hypothetical protein